jgi:integrase
LEQVERWCVDFYDLVGGAGPSAVVEGFGAVRERAVGNGARHGTPVIVSSLGRVDPRVNLFFRTGEMADRAPSTWRRYAYALAVWLEFLAVFGREWHEATARDVEAFKHWRLTDPSNAERIAPSSFDTDRAALNSFYRWASLRYGVANPVPTVPAGARRGRDQGGWGSGRERAGRDPIRPAGAKRSQVKWMLRPAMEQWRDIGLRGYGFDGLRRRNWRGGGCEDRDVAFVEGLFGTGLRLREWASVLDVELPALGADQGGGRFPKAWLSAACIKGGGQGREYRVPRSTLTAVAAYTDPVEGSRVEAVARARQAGRYDRLPVRIVTGYNPRSRVLHLAGVGGASRLSVDVVGPDERRLLFRETPAGLEPLALWLTTAGLPKRPYGWEDTFQDANGRVAEVWVDARFPGVRGPERERRKAECPLWCRPHMARHSFALKWFSILSVVWEQRVEGFNDEELRDLREQFGGIWFQMMTLLGHKDPMTSRNIYLEPFAALEVDYLMSLLDEEEHDAVQALTAAVAARSGRVLAAASVLEHEVDHGTGGAL